MSIIGILSSNLFSAGAIQNTQSSQKTPSTFQQIKTEFQQLGQDLQSGNVSAAQSDFTTLSKNLSTLFQTPAATTTATATATNPSASPLATAFAQLGQDLQSGNLQAAQQDYSTVQQDAQQQSASQQVSGHDGHHRHHTESSQSSSSSSSQQTNPINQAYSALAQDLQAGNLSGAQSAFSALQNDLQQIGGFLPAGSNSATGAAAPSSTGNLNVTA
jgi:outer membrane protein assembly factor BamD (BamD/ComL family)